MTMPASVLQHERRRMRLRILSELAVRRIDAGLAPHLGPGRDVDAGETDLTAAGHARPRPPAGDPAA